MTAPNPHRIVTAAERRKLVPYSDMHIWRLEQEGRFPRRLKLGPNRVGWLLSEIEEWIAQRAAEREPAEAREASHGN